jgi:hypothetical protein
MATIEEGRDALADLAHIIRIGGENLLRIEEGRDALADLALIMRLGRENMRPVIRLAASSGVTVSEISKATGLARTTIYRIITEPAGAVSESDTVLHDATTCENS